MSEINDVPLYQVIGAPLLALVQAEAQSAQATARYIQEIGFENSTENPLEFGNLKSITFKYNKVSAGGKLTTLEVQIPVLSIVPIPAIQIKEAEIDFAVEINSLVELSVPTAINSFPEKTNSASPASAENIKQDSSLSPELVAFKVGISNRDTKNAINIKLKIEQAEMPSGLLALFRVLDQGITSVETSAGSG